MDPILIPFTPTLFIIIGLAAVVGGVLGVDKWQEHRFGKVYKVKKLEDREADEKAITRIVSEAFTGRAEADHHFRAEALNNYKTVLREALDDHSKDERKYIDTLRDKIVEYHTTSLQAVNDAKRVALHVSTEYQAIQRRLSELEKEIENLRLDLQEIARKP